MCVKGVASGRGVALVLTINPVTLNRFHGVKGISAAGGVNLCQNDLGALALVGNVEELLGGFDIPHRGHNCVVGECNVVVEHAAANAFRGRSDPEILTVPKACKFGIPRHTYRDARR